MYNLINRLRTKTYEPTMSRSIYIVRHPQSTMNALIDTCDPEKNAEMKSQLTKEADVDITELGKKQAEMTADFLLRITGITCNVLFSPMKRCKYLSELLLRGEQIDVLIEHNSRQKQNTWTKDKTFASFTRRVISFYNAYVVKQTTDCIIIGHGVFLSVLLELFLLKSTFPTMSDDQIVNALNKQSNNVKFKLNNASISTLEISENNNVIVQTINYTQHLQ